MDEIENIFADIVSTTAKGCTITTITSKGEAVAKSDVNINYLYGSSTYIKDTLDVLSKSKDKSKFPLIALFTPNVATIDSSLYAYRTKLSLIIATSSRKDWNNLQRMQYSFEYILLPIYHQLIATLLEDERFDWGYGVDANVVKHTMSKNFDYGRYGAYDAAGGEVSEPIDAIDIRSLEVTINNSKCS